MASTISNLRTIVEYLSRKIGPRPYSRPDLLKRVKDYIANKFDELGLAVWFQEFSYNRETYWNVLAAKRNIFEGSVSGKLLVIGAHYDTVSGSPGADDNASGVAGLVELARGLGQDLPDNVLLCAFTLEEPPCYRTRHMGSYKVAKLLRKNRVRLHGMISLEMLGYFSDRPGSQSFPLPLMRNIYPDRGNFIGIVGNLWSRKFTEEVKSGFLKAGLIPTESLSAPFFVIGADLSDHWSFYKFGYKATMITDTAFYRNPHYHRITDLPETLDFDRMAKVVESLRYYVLDMSSSNSGL